MALATAPTTTTTTTTTTTNANSTDVVLTINDDGDSDEDEDDDDEDDANSSGALDTDAVLPAPQQQRNSRKSPSPVAQSTTAAVEMTKADKAVSTTACASDEDELLSDADAGDVQHYRQHSVCLEVAQLQAVLDRLVAGKVHAMKSAEDSRRKALERRRQLRRNSLLALSPRTMVQRLRRRRREQEREEARALRKESSPAADGGAGGRRRKLQAQHPEQREMSAEREQQQQLRRAEALATVSLNGDGRGLAGGEGGDAAYESGRIRKLGRSKQRICSSTPDSPRYNQGVGYERSNGHPSDDEIVFNRCETPCCCDGTNGHITATHHQIPDSAFDSDYVSVKIDDDDGGADYDCQHLPPPGPLPAKHRLHPHHRHLDVYTDVEEEEGEEEYDDEEGDEYDGEDGEEYDAVESVADRERRRRRRRRRKRRKRRRQLAAQVAAAAAAAAAHGGAYGAHLRLMPGGADVRVIDADELSRKARLTIAATACLLLFMCLLLVGVTLRMAPLIDEMVRQENRDMLKSLQREATPNVSTTPSPFTRTL